MSAALVLFATPDCAAEAIKYPVPIPQECFELARREGVPTMIESKYQAVKARLKLARLSGKDPLVVECRAAVERAKAQAAAARQIKPVQGTAQGMRSTTGQSGIPNTNRNDAIRSEAIP